ncbi:MAG: hypothetical protein BYD32DRAFT_435375 [Podila humilis]|nr:MAG: hypothetical protein BYD32DRAFT_435375 [Podila humilis]
MDTLNNGMLGVTLHGPPMEINPSVNPLTAAPPQPEIVLQQAIDTLKNLNDSKLNLQRSETQIVLELHGCMDEGQRADLQREAERVKAEIEAVETRIAPIATTVKRLKKAMSHEMNNLLLGGMNENETYHQYALRVSHDMKVFGIEDKTLPRNRDNRYDPRRGRGRGRNEHGGRGNPQTEINHAGMDTINTNGQGNNYNRPNNVFGQNGSPRYQHNNNNNNMGSPGHRQLAHQRPQQQFDCANCGVNTTHNTTQCNKNKYCVRCQKAGHTVLECKFTPREQHGPNNGP